MENKATFTISSQESTEGKDADVKNREEGIASAISEERSLTDALCSRSIPDEIVKIAENKPVAVFDFDGTLSSRDSLIPFLFYLNGVSKTLFHLLTLIPKFIFFLCIGKGRQSFKEALIEKTLQPHAHDFLVEKSHNFAEWELDKIIKKEAIERFYWHKRQGHFCVLASANLSLFLEPWAKKNGFDLILASQLDVNLDGRLSGKIQGINCFGEEKVRRLKEALGEVKSYLLYAYGDSAGDIPLLAYADIAFYKSFTIPLPCKNLKKSTL